MGRVRASIKDANFDENNPLIGIFYTGSIVRNHDKSVKKISKIPKIKLFITDPPYNIGFNYGEGVTDCLKQEDYSKLLEDTFDRCWELADDNAHLFIIHYPEAIAKHWSELTKKWNFKQWLSWNYPTNTGHSDNQWTRAHRAILWLTKGDPYFDPRAVTQNFKNPSVKVVKQKVSEGILGVSLYDWWVIPQVKNVSLEYQGYENQIPSELLRRIVLCSSKPGDWVGDPFSGSFSTARTALNLGRRAWGCDINPEVSKFWPKELEWQPRKEDVNLGNVDSDRYDEILKFITKKQLDDGLFRLLLDADEGQLKKVIGPVNGPRIFNILNPSEDVPFIDLRKYSENSD